MTAKTVSKTDQNLDVKLELQLSRQCVRLLSPLQLLLSDSVTAWILSCRRLYDLSRRRVFFQPRIASSIGGALTTLFGLSALGNPQQLFLSRLLTQFRLCFAEWQLKKHGKDRKNHQSVITSYAEIPTTIVTIGGCFSSCKPYYV